MIRTRRGAMTLIELLVAMALGVMLISIVTFLWMQSNRIFQGTIRNLESYQRLRCLLDVIERDIANTNRTVDMEFHTDSNGNGHWDVGEPLIGGAPPAFRKPNDTRDPCFTDGKEFLTGGRAPDDLLEKREFFYAPMIFSPQPYEILNDGYLEPRSYWQDEIYLRSFVDAYDRSNSALVHYRLVRQTDGRSALRRRVWFTDPAGAIVTAPNPAATDQVSLLATGVCDLKFAFFFRPSASAGATIESSWYHVGCPDGDAKAQALFKADRERGFLSALGDAGQPAISTQHTRNGPKRNPFQAADGGANVMSFHYEGVARLEQTSTQVLLRTINDINDPAPAAGTLDKYTNFDFPGVRPNDKIFLFEAKDDDGTQIVDNPSTPLVEGVKQVFPDQVFTIDEIPAVLGGGGASASTSIIQIALREPIDFYALRRYWLDTEWPGTETDFKVLQDPHVNANPSAGPPRSIRASFNVKYRVGFVPPAVLVRLSIDDKTNMRLHLMERVIRVLQS